MASSSFLPEAHGAAGSASEPAPRRGPRALVREEPGLIFATALAALAYSAFSIARHAHFGSGGFDLAIFDQAIWHYSRLESPASTVVPLATGLGRHPPLVFPSVLGDHFSPILVLLAPLYWVWADARMLLAAQGVLIAASAVPVFLYARSKVGRGPAYGLTGAYLLFWGILSAVEYDFHEVAFAPLLIASAVLFAERRRWIPLSAALVLLLLTKEDLSLVVVAFGLWLLVRREIRPAVATILGGIGWYFAATRLLIPHFSGGLPFNHWTYGSLGSNPPDVIANTIRDPLRPLRRFVEPSTKLKTLAYLLAPWLGTCLLSPLIVVALPLVAERMLSDKPLLWTTHFHYSLAIAPILAMSSADGLARAARLARPRLGRAAASVVPLAMVGIVVVGVAIFSRWPQFEALTRLSFRSSFSGQRVDLHPGSSRSAQRAVAAVPAHRGSVSTQANLLPHLSARDRVYLLREGLPRTDYIVYEVGGSPFPYRRVDVERFLASRGREYAPVFSERGYVVLKRRPPQPPSPRR